MTIRKYLHSCLLLEESGKKLLIDPGAFCFLEGKLKPEDIGPVDVILLTHKHPDHYDPAALKTIIGSSPLGSNNNHSILRASEAGYRTVPGEARREVPTILTHSEIATTIESLALSDEKAKLWSIERIESGQTKTFASFTIQAFAAAHGPIPAEPPHNLAYLINGKLLHPGDSLDMDERSVASSKEAKLQRLPVLALPIAGPWLRLVDALALAKNLKPAHVIPIHDAIIKDFMLEKMYAMCKSALESVGIEFHPLGLGEMLDI